MAGFFFQALVPQSLTGWGQALFYLSMNCFQSSFQYNWQQEYLQEKTFKKASFGKGNVQCLFSAFLKFFGEFIPYKQLSSGGLFNKVMNSQSGWLTSGMLLKKKSLQFHFVDSCHSHIAFYRSVQLAVKC